MRTNKILFAALFMLHACGGEPAGNDTTRADDVSTGDERVEEPPVEVSAAPDPDPVPSGPVDVTVNVKVGGEQVAGTVALIDESGDTVAEGSSGQSFTVQSGAYQITASISDASVLIDTPSQTEEAQLVPGEAQTVDVVFPRAQVLLNVTRNGRAIRRPEVTLFRQGSEEPSATFRVGASHVPISPGRYEADVKLSGHEIRVRGLTFMDGATQSIPVNIE